MSIVGKLGSLASDAALVKKRVGSFIKKTPKQAQKVNIISDDITKTPGVLNLVTGTKTFRDVGAGIRVVQPGADTRLGQLGVETVTTFPKGYFLDFPQKLIALQFKGAKSAMGLQTPQELKATLEFVKEMQKLEKQAANPVNRVVNALKEALTTQPSLKS